MTVGWGSWVEGCLFVTAFTSGRALSLSQCIREGSKVRLKMKEGIVDPLPEGGGAETQDARGSSPGRAAEFQW